MDALDGEWWRLEGQSVADVQRELSHLDQTVEEEWSGLDKATHQLQQTKSAQDILQRLSEAVQQKAHRQIAEVVTSCLQAVFGDKAYEFQIQFERKRGKTEAHLWFVRDGELHDPLTSTGGGMVAVAAFALRVACLVLHRPRLSKVLVLDEPFANVSAQYQDNVRAMLEGLAEDMGLQLVLVTHNPALATGKIIEIE